jgi:hypothetical protein
MPLSFPPNPQPGDLYQAPNGTTYVWNGSYWAAQSTGGGSSGGTGGSGGAAIVLANGTTVTYTATSLNFVGAVITASVTGTSVSINVNHPATTSSLGVIQVGPTLTIDGAGVLNSNAGNLAYWAETSQTSGGDGLSILTPVGEKDNIDAVIATKGLGAHIGADSGNKRGHYATDWQKNIVNQDAVASGDYSIISGGSLNKATAVHSVIIGGNKNLADSNYGVVLGGTSGHTAGIVGAVVIPGFATGGTRTEVGGVQGGVYMFGGETTDGSFHTMTTDASWTPTANNQLTLRDNTAIHFTGKVVAKEFRKYRGEVWSWTFEGTIRRDVGSTTTDFIPSAVAPVVSVVQGINTASGWQCVLDIDNGNGALVIKAKGNSSQTIRWACRLDTVEVHDVV